MHAKLNVHGAEKRKRNRCPCYTTGSRLMNTKPLCLSHLEIDWWKLLWYISFFVNISFYFSAYFLLAWIFILYFPLPTPITFLMVHLTLRAEPPNLSSDAKWSSERMNNSAAERVHGQSLSFIQWRIQGKDPEGAGHPLFLDQTETRKAEKFFLETGSPLPHLRVWRTWTPLPYYLKVWIWNCYAPINVNPVEWQISKFLDQISRIKKHFKSTFLLLLFKVNVSSIKLLAVIKYFLSPPAFLIFNNKITPGRLTVLL